MERLLPRSHLAPATGSERDIQREKFVVPKRPLLTKCRLTSGARQPRAGHRCAESSCDAKRQFPAAVLGWRAGSRANRCEEKPASACSILDCVFHTSYAASLTQAAGIEVTSLLFCSFQDLKEKKEVVEETENGRDAPANGNAENEENGEQEADNEVDEEEEEGGEEEDEEEEGDGEEEDGDEDDEAEGATGKRAAEDDEDDDVDPKKQKTDEDD
ncbi:prothymosin alpha [Athene cunicularia]|uniref:prothymosin alpha n=1 Tax=Athene cunicularia TaxID=194338 RepID=UPI000EF6EDAC|nr:prothymosin alpha [Athene cunicularia]